MKSGRINNIIGIVQGGGKAGRDEIVFALWHSFDSNTFEGGSDTSMIHGFLNDDHFLFTTYNFSPHSPPQDPQCPICKVVQSVLMKVISRGGTPSVLLCT